MITSENMYSTNISFSQNSIRSKTRLATHYTFGPVLIELVNLMMENCDSLKTISCMLTQPSFVVNSVNGEHGNWMNTVIV